MTDNENVTIEELVSVKLGDVYFFKYVKQNGKEYFLSKNLFKNIVLKNKDKERRAGYFKILEIVKQDSNTVIAYGERVTPLDIYPQINSDEASETLKNFGFEVSSQMADDHSILYGMLNDRQSAILTVATYSKNGRLDTFLVYIPSTDEFVDNREINSMEKGYGFKDICSGYWVFDLAKSRSRSPMKKLKKKAEEQTWALNLGGDKELLLGTDFKGNKIHPEKMDEKVLEFLKNHSLS